MNNACPQCGAVYAVAEKDVGRRIACKKCSTALIVSEAGLQRHDGAPVAAPPVDVAERDDDRGRKRELDEEDRSSKKRNRDDDRKERSGRQADDRPGMGDFFKRIRQGVDTATWLYALGMVLTIYSFFAPKIDEARVTSRQGDLDQLQADDDADLAEFKQRNDGNPTEEDRKRRDRSRKEHERERPRLDAKIKFAEAAARQSAWWNIMYRLIGLSLLGLGSVAYLSGEQPILKRILGGVTIGLILLEVVGGGVGVNLRMGHQPATVQPSVSVPPK